MKKNSHQRTIDQKKADNYIYKRAINQIYQVWISNTGQKAKGSKQRFAEELHVQPGTLSKYLTGENRPSPEVLEELKAIASNLGMSTNIFDAASWELIRSSEEETKGYISKIERSNVVQDAYTGEEFELCSPEFLRYLKSTELFEGYPAFGSDFFNTLSEGEKSAFYFLKAYDEFFGCDEDEVHEDLYDFHGVTGYANGTSLEEGFTPEGIRKALGEYKSKNVGSVWQYQRKGITYSFSDEDREYISRIEGHIAEQLRLILYSIRDEAAENNKRIRAQCRAIDKLMTCRLSEMYKYCVEKYGEPEEGFEWPEGLDSEISEYLAKNGFNSFEIGSILDALAEVGIKNAIEQYKALIGNKEALDNGKDKEDRS